MGSSLGAVPPSNVQGQSPWSGGFWRGTYFSVINFDVHIILKMAYEYFSLSSLKLAFILFTVSSVGLL